MVVHILPSMAKALLGLFGIRTASSIVLTPHTALSSYYSGFFKVFLGPDSGP